MGRGRRREELLGVEGRCPQGGMGGGGWLQAAAAGGGLRCCAETVTAGKPDRSKKGLVSKIKSINSQLEPDSALQASAGDDSSFPQN